MLDNNQVCDLYQGWFVTPPLCPQQATGLPEHTSDLLVHIIVLTVIWEKSQCRSTTLLWGHRDIFTCASPIQQVSLEDARNDDGICIGNPTKLAVALGVLQWMYCQGSTYFAKAVASAPRGGRTNIGGLERYNLVLFTSVKSKHRQLRISTGTLGLSHNTSDPEMCWFPLLFFPLIVAIYSTIYLTLTSQQEGSGFKP